jgi:hypothetical protein
MYAHGVTHSCHKGHLQYESSTQQVSNMLLNVIPHVSLLINLDNNLKIHQLNKTNYVLKLL